MLRMQLAGGALIPTNLDTEASALVSLDLDRVGTFILTSKD